MGIDMAWVWFTLAILLLFVFNTVGVVLVLVQLPGTWIMILATAIVAWLFPDWIGWVVVAVMFGLAVLGEILEFAAGAVGAVGGGSSKTAAAAAVAGAIIGAIVGTFALAFLPIIGTLIGATLGAGIAAFAVDIKKGIAFDQSFKGGIGAAIGRLGGAVGKFGVSVVMWVVSMGALVIP